MELYDLSADPNERRNLYRPDAPSALALNRSFQEWLSATPRHYSAQAALDGTQYRRLKSLGYLQ